MQKRTFLASTLAVCVATLATPALAADAAFPTKALRLVVPFAAGGPADAVARGLALKLGEDLGQTVVVENMGGGHGIPAMNAVGRSAADGHTLLMAASGNVTIQPLTMKASAEAFARLAPVSVVSSSPHVLVVSSKLPVKTTQELIDYAKKNPGKVNFASAGTGGLAHLGMELFKALSRTDIEHIPYKGTAQVMTDLASGEVQALFSSMPSLKGLIEKGTIRALGLTSASKADDAASLPLISATLPGMEYTTWYGVFTPVGTPAPVVDKLNAALRRAVADKELVETMRQQSVDMMASSPKELQDWTRRDTEKWARLIKEEKLKIH